MKIINETPQPELSVATTQPIPVIKPMPTPIEILQSAIEGGITEKSVAVVESLTRLCREQRAEDAKIAFNRAWFQLRKGMPILYADKEVKTKSGDVAFQYVSPQEIKDCIEPLMSSHGFCTMVGQTLTNGEVTVTVTLMHEAGHSELRSYTTRVSPGNSLMSPTQCDAAATTNAERQALIKIFGIRTRVRAEDDPRNIGEAITREQAESLQHRVKMLNAPEQSFLKWAGVPNAAKTPTLADYEKIPSTAFVRCDEFLCKKEAGGK